MRPEKIKALFSKNCYVTPPNTSHELMDKVLLKSRWWLYFRFSLLIMGGSLRAFFNRYGEPEWIVNSYRIFQATEGVGARYKITGLENLRKTDKPAVIISNHMSTLETMAFPCIICPFRSLTFVVKAVLVKGWIFGRLMRSRDPIVVGRKSAMEDFRVVMSKGQEILNSGRSLVIFPQSTRSVDFIPEKFNSLGIKLAKKAGVPIIPTAIKTDFWSNSPILKGFGPLYREKTIHIAFGEPIEIKGNGKEEHKHVIDYIQSHLDQWEQK